MNRCLQIAALSIAAFQIADPSTVAAQQKRMALVIGIDNYFDLTPLKSSCAEAESMRDVLKSRCGFTHVKCLVDKRAGELKPADMAQLRRDRLMPQIKQFTETAGREGADTLLIYFNGHGHRAANGDLGLCAIDADADPENRVLNTVSRSELEELLAEADIPEKILVLDCCHASARGKTFGLGSQQLANEVRRDSRQVPKPVRNTGNRFVVLSSSGAREAAAEGLFTRHLVDGLDANGRSADDRNNDSQIDVEELFNFVRSAMAAAPGRQRPSKLVLAGDSSNSIAMAPAVFTMDPRLSMKILVRTDDEQPISGAKIQLQFLPNGATQSRILGTQIAAADGAAVLQYRLGETRELTGQYRLAAQKAGDQVTTPIAQALVERGGTAAVLNMVVHHALEPVPDPAMNRISKAPTPIRRFTYQQVLKSITDYVARDNTVEDICSIKKGLPAYGKIMLTLPNREWLKVSGFTVCFPTQIAWNNRPEIRMGIIQTLQKSGVLGQSAPRRTGSFQGAEPRFSEVKLAASQYVIGLELDVCGLKELLPGYAEIMNELRKDQKFEALPGLPVCFPSEKTWREENKIRRRILDVLWRENVL